MFLFWDGTICWPTSVLPAVRRTWSTRSFWRIPKLSNQDHGGLDRRGVQHREAALVPVGVGEIHCAGGVEFGDLLLSQIPADGAEVLFQLLFVARADDYGGDGGRSSSQLSAICETVLPVSLATASRASTTLYK